MGFVIPIDDLQELGPVSIRTWRRVLLTKPVPTGKEPWPCQEYLLGLPGTVALQLFSLMVLMQIVALKSPLLICLPL